MVKALSPQKMTNVGYASFLMTFAALGTFVYALAVGNPFAVALGAFLVVCLIVMVVGFRIGAHRRAESNDSGIAIDGANVWAQPLRREQIDQYLMQYRGAQTADNAQTADKEEAEPAVIAGGGWQLAAGRLAA